MMLLSSDSIYRLTNIITGHAGLSYKIVKSEIEAIFSEALNEVVGESYSRFFEDYPEITNSPLYSSTDFKLFNYVKIMLEEINGTSQIERLISTYFDQIFNYSEQEEEVVQYLNEKFEEDNYSIEWLLEKETYRIYSLDDCLVSYDCLFKESQRGNFILINEHNKKCFDKLKSGDYAGAITNSRSLLEQILREIQVEFRLKNSERRGGYNGHINGLLKDVLTRMDIKRGLQGQVLTGYESLEDGFDKLVNGLSVIRHGMSDAHNISHPPTEKDAVLVVNTAKTLANFIVKTYFEKFAYAA